MFNAAKFPNIYFKTGFQFTNLQFLRIKNHEVTIPYNYTNRNLTNRKYNLINRQIVLSQIISILLQKI
jgi:hypothetical protein